MAAAIAPNPAKSQMRRFLVLFPVCLVFGFAALEAPPVARVIASFTQSLVWISGALIHLFGGHAVVTGTVLTAPAGFGVKVENGCNAVNVTILLWAAILTYPASWSAKTKGLTAGSLALHSVNLLRIITLFYLGQYNRAWFDFAHYYLWESLIVLDTLAIFWFWATLVRRSGPQAHAATA
jgi:exosortase H (IPTLxxWG-CTERM-specific)